MLIGIILGLLVFGMISGEVRKARAESAMIALNKRDKAARKGKP